jgi:hypothetical protein
VPHVGVWEKPRDSPKQQSLRSLPVGWSATGTDQEDREKRKRIADDNERETDEDGREMIMRDDNERW